MIRVRGARDGLHQKVVRQDKTAGQEVSRIETQQYSQMCLMMISLAVFLILLKEDGPQLPP